VHDVEHYVDRIVQVRGTPRAELEGLRQSMLGMVAKSTPDQLDHWARRQCYIALGFLLSSAAVMGIDACPMEGIAADKLDQVLGLPALGFGTTVAASLGYRAADDWLASLPKVRFEASEVVIRR
jgi:nitroreductase